MNKITWEKQESSNTVDGFQNDMAICSLYCRNGFWTLGSKFINLSIDDLEDIIEKLRELNIESDRTK